MLKLAQDAHTFTGVAPPSPQTMPRYPLNLIRRAGDRKLYECDKTQSYIKMYKFSDLYRFTSGSFRVAGEFAIPGTG